MDLLYLTMTTSLNICFSLQVILLQMLKIL
nr:MAG TPA: hypothetical protein [Caudoviricetes sp.]